MPKISRSVFLSILFLFVPILAFGQSSISENPKLIVFHSPTCHKCIQVKNEVMPDIAREFQGQITIEYRDISDLENYKLLIGLQEKYNEKTKIDLPVFFLGGSFFHGQTQNKNELRQFIIKLLKISREKRYDLQDVDLVTRFKAFAPFTIVSAGLIDGINPCAFTVLVFFISFLTLQGYKRRESIIIGLSFIFSVFLTYILIGLGLFGFLYRLKNFWLITKIFNFSVGALSIVLGFFALYDFFKYKRTKQTEGLVLQLPAAIKNRIHSVIGLHYRKTKDTQGQLVLERHTLRLILSAIITGFLVSLLEAVCTGQVYLPTITFVLKTTHLKLQALSYLLLYNFMFIVPLCVIFFFALLGVTSVEFSNFLKKYLLMIKILMTILFFALGIFLIWRA